MIAFILILLILASFTPLGLALAGRMRWGVATGLTVGSLVVVGFGWYWASVYMDSLWFENLGFSSVFWSMLQYKWVGFAIAFAVFFVLARLALWLFEQGVSYRTTGESTIKYLVISLLSFGYGLVMYGKWDKVVLFLNGGSFGVADPIFGKDVGFYVFQLPFYNSISTILFTMFLVVLALMGLFLVYYQSQQAEINWRRIIRSFCIVGALALGVLVWMRFLANYGYLFSERGVVYGVGYSDTFSIVMNKVFIGSIFLCIILLLVGAFRSGLFRSKRFFVGLGSVLPVFGLLLLILPALTQVWVVKPNEFQKEQTYIQNNIGFTRLAYNLEGIEESEFAPVTLTTDIAEENRDTLDNVRVWDWRALASSYEQLQSFRLYYTFADVDIDRYVIDGEYRQVMLSAREIDQSRLLEKTWVNEHLVYTHGYGIIVSEVNVSDNGSPSFIVENIPPVSSVDEIQITNPAIYFGDFVSGYVIANGNTMEFDYPQGDENVYTSYDGQGGVEINSFVRKLAGAIKFNDLSILITGEINPDSRLMWARDIQERVHNVAPYLQLDNDNYLVIGEDGTLVWVQDAYTISDRYPYSSPWYYLNYIRNSVKATVDAYNGDVSLYVFDDSDPIVNAYRKAFPALFKDSSEMPVDIANHIRYPEDMLSIQAQIYGTFHMTDPMVYYNKEDVWVFATEVLEQGVEQQIIPYYVLIRLPDNTKEEFVQMIPFTPSGKQNAIGWMAGRCDGEEYGELVVYKFPKQSLVYGTMQFEALVNQNDEMASQFTLWTKTSTVIRGNTLIIPINNSLFYVEPIYLQSETARMPQLARVIVGGVDTDGNLRVAWGGDCYSALERLLGEEVSTPTLVVVAPTDLTEALQDLLDKLVALKSVSMQNFPSELDRIISQLEEILAGVEE